MSLRHGPTVPTSSVRQLEKPFDSFHDLLLSAAVALPHVILPSPYHMPVLSLSLASCVITRPAAVRKRQSKVGAAGVH
jgi:hypothetical protein